MLGIFGFFRMPRAHKVLRGSRRLIAVAGLTVVHWVGPALAFDYGHYQAADLDALAARKPVP